MTGAGGRDPSALARNREVWRCVNDQFTDADADERWAADEVSWGLFRHPEHRIGALGDVAGQDVLEVGCGTAYLSGWLARAGARCTAVDLSPAQLASAQRCAARHGAPVSLVEADGEQLPFAAASFDLVVSEYGAAPWCAPEHWLAEAARVLRAGGRLVFLTNSVLAAMCVPASSGPAGDRLLRGPDDLSPVTWPGGGTEHHPGHGDWIRALTGAGFVVDALHELRPPDGAPAHTFYEIVSPAWAGRWPAEDLWVAHLGGAGPGRGRPPGATAGG